MMSQIVTINTDWFLYGIEIRVNISPSKAAIDFVELFVLITGLNVDKFKLTAKFSSLLLMAAAS